MTQVILGEDEAQLHALIAEMLFSMGVQVSEAADRREAREIRTLIKPFDPDRMCELVVDMLARP